MSIVGVFHMAFSLLEYLICKQSPKDASKNVEEGKGTNKVEDDSAGLRKEVEEVKRNHQHLEAKF